MPEILFFGLEPWEREWLAARSELFSVGLYQEPLRPNSLQSDPQVWALSGFIRDPVTREVLDRLPALRLVCTRSTGYDHVDLEACRERGITVCNVPHYGEHTVAEHTFALILALSRKVHQAYQRTSRLDFSFSGLLGFDLRGKTLGVIGAGNIGLRVIQIARGFGMEVLAYDPNEQSLLAEVLGYRHVPLDTLLAEADVVSLHVPLIPQTRHLIDREALRKMKPGVLLINTARGGVVDTTALLEALDSGHVSGAGLDVFEGEQFITEEGRMQAPDLSADSLRAVVQDFNLLRRENVIITPHIAWYSREARERILETTLDNLHAYREGHPKNVVLPGREGQA